MALLDKMLAFIGSKWFILFLTIGFALALPSTFKGMAVAWHPWAITVFIMNVLGVGIGFWKFMVAITEKSSQVTTQSQSW